MRGLVDTQETLFFCFNVEDRIPKNHPLRKIKQKADLELRALCEDFDKAYSSIGRPSIPVEQLIKATLLQALYSIRSERLLCEQIAYNMLFQWFLDLPPDKRVWDHSTFTKNRQRMAEHGLLAKFFCGSVAQAIQAQAASEEHFSVDGTLIAAWASMKSFRPKDDKSQDDSGGDAGGAGQGNAPDQGDSNRWVDWHGEKRSNETHESRTDPEAQLARKGKGQSTLLAHSMHVVMENRHGLVMDVVVEQADGTAEREAALAMMRDLKQNGIASPKTLGADKGYDDGQFLHDLESELKIIPHVAIREGNIVAEDASGQARRRARRRQTSSGYAVSQRVRKRIEEIFGWFKDIGQLRKTRFVGRWKTQLYAYAVASAYNFLRLSNLEARA